MWRALLALAAIAVVAAQIPCGQPNPATATCICNGTTYNMSNFRDAQGNTRFAGTNGDYRYFFDLLGLPANFTGCTFPSSQATGNAAAQSPIAGGSCYPIGVVAQQVWSLVPANGSIPQSLAIIFSGGEEGRMAALNVQCDPTVSAAGFVALGETAPGSLIYQFAARSCAACPGATPCRALPPPPPPPPLASSCKAVVTSEPWGNLFGGIQGFGQGPMATAKTCGLQYRVYAYQGVSGPAIGHEDNVYTGNTNGVLLTRHETPVQYFRLAGGNIVSNIALLDGAFHVVTANQSAMYLHIHTLAGQDADTMVLLAPGPAPGKVTVLANPSTAAIYVHAGASVYHVVFGKVQNTFALPVSVASACLALNPDASHLIVTAGGVTYGLEPLTLKEQWSVAGLPAAGCPLVFRFNAAFYNATAFVLIDITVGLIAATLPVTRGCIGQAVFTSQCWLVCPTSASNITAFDANTSMVGWTANVGGAVTSLVADNSTGILALAAAVDRQSVQLTRLAVDTGATLWATRVPGRGGSIGLDKHGGVNVFTLGSTQSYVYGFGPNGEGNKCPSV
eukprot:m.235893 g.235893  ORF g.235893 m.235893 type:complete len:563 (-) comp20326_c0_seq1:109-1797(-)